MALARLDRREMKLYRARALGLGFGAEIRSGDWLTAYCSIFWHRRGESFCMFFISFTKWTVCIGPSYGETCGSFLDTIERYIRMNFGY